MIKRVKKQLEADLSADIHAYALIRGWWGIKVETPTMNGVMDRLYYRPKDGYIWMELKRPDGEGELSAIQEFRARDMRKRGMVVHLVDSYTQAREILR